ncbi:hypothetical protein CN204_04825 [Sinorhizobium meliloti]|uniref:hypothetical protein n=1 Tax=Rhizobium meliloti TaxID=382 RepID=UPI000FD9F4B7|nr:hypothetical protein [Sinorhizobium meliloti]RVH87569.1 hypothetical protein CN204_04825 [Sinorhizobium meliloti]RVM22423.1 hypothetical protein CN132_26065 [Sinorhizobium meliloti]RVO02914.1 hypothetical protein CN102_24095 [Sinorhizobium meliloti]
MVRTMIGVDSTGAGCVKIMKRDADNPRTTPDSQRSKFLYNSKYVLNASIAHIERVNTIPGGSGTQYFPAGSNSSNYQKLVAYGDAGGFNEAIWVFKNSAFPDVKYNMPLFDVKATRNSTGRFNQMKIQRRYSGKYYNDQGGYLFMGNWRQAPWFKDYEGLVSNWGSFPYGTVTRINNSDTNDAYNRFQSSDKRLIVWNLPGNEDPSLEAPVLAPNGSKNIIIRSDKMIIAKPGYNAETATEWQISFDSRRVPVKVIAAADIAIPAGESFYDTGITLTTNIALDVHFYTGSTIYYPWTPDMEDGAGAEYWFSGTRIYFNAASAMRARFMLYLDAGDSPTNGSNKVFRQFTEGGVDVVQFLRPGSANPPSWADIVIDSRWPCVQIIKEGYFPVSAGSPVETIVNFDATGMFPMVKYMTKHGPGSDQNFGSWQASIKLPSVRQLIYSTSSNFECGDSSHCRLTQTSATFVTNRGRPGDYYNDDDDPGTWRTEGADDVLGIRYYILGIPA